MTPEPTSLPEAKRIFDTMKGTLCNLWERWRNEHEYEDFNEYRAATRKQLTAVAPAATFISLSKRPFALAFKLESTEYILKVTARKYVLRYRAR